MPVTIRSSNRKRTLVQLPAAAALLTASTMHAQQAAPFHHPIGFAAQANIHAQDCCCPGFTNGTSYPLGAAWYAGVRFEHGPPDRYAFMGGTGCGGAPRALQVDVGVPGTGTLSVLLSSWGGCGVGPDFLGTATFRDGSSMSWVLRHGIDYRDHNGDCLLTGTRSQQVWSSGTGQRLDLLTLPLQRPGTVVETFRIESSVPYSQDAAPFVFGITASDSVDCNGDGLADYGQVLDGTFDDANRNGIPDRVCECLGDFDADGAITGADLGQMLAAWGSSAPGAPADLNADGSIDGFDLAYLLAGWGRCQN